MTTLYQYVFSVAHKYHSYCFVTFRVRCSKLTFENVIRTYPDNGILTHVPYHGHTILWVSNDPSTHVHSNSKPVNSTPVLQLVIQFWRNGKPQNRKEEIDQNKAENKESRRHN